MRLFVSVLSISFFDFPTHRHFDIWYRQERSLSRSLGLHSSTDSVVKDLQQVDHYHIPPLKPKLPKRCLLKNLLQTCCNTQFNLVDDTCKLKECFFLEMIYI